ncbi:hypothetical protein EJB05_09247, partial [Eragrostis curvula]
TLLLVLISYSRLSFHHKGHSSAMSSATGKGDASGSGSKRAYVLAMFRLASQHLFLLDVHVYVLYIFFLLMAKCFNYVVCTLTTKLDRDCIYMYNDHVLTVPVELVAGMPNSDAVSFA